jgi:hypothetical protein
MAERDPARTQTRTALLDLAQQRHDLVRVTRSLPESDGSVGHVVSSGPRWVLLSVLAAGAPDGWVALRTGDIDTVESAPGGRFVQRGLEFQHSWPPRAPVNTIPTEAGSRPLLAAAAAAFPLVTVYLENEDPVACLVGRPVGYGQGFLEWQQLSTGGAWEPPSRVARLAAVTRIEFGGQYHRALHHVSYLRSLLDLDQGNTG